MPQASSPLWRWALPLAAVAVLAAGATLINLRQAADTPVETVRGTELQPTGPAGTILGQPVFRWQSPLRDVRYRVTVQRGSTVVWVGTVDTTEAAPPASTSFEPGAEYTWQVEALDREGEVRMSSPPQTFTIS